MPGRRRPACQGMAAVLLGCVAAHLASGPAPAAARPGIPPKGRLGSLAVFARFADESGPRTPPEWATELFEARRAGGLSHFYEEMSRGQFQLTGQVLPRVYSSRGTASQYLAPGIGMEGAYGRFVQEVLAAADAETDFGRFDSDGPDGVPNSGDDDGYVDFLFVVMQSTPARFVVSDADGIERLGLNQDYVTGDTGARGGAIRVRADTHPHAVGGTVQRGRSLAEAAGTMAHELGHALGLPDLYDTGYTASGAGLDPEDDSAGIGYWGLMGHGARGWNDQGGPNPLCAWSREQLGWIGADNADLVTLQRREVDLPFEDVNAGGKVYRVDTPGADEYYLLEYRGSGASYYERDLPATGLLIWHIRGTSFTNNDEAAKRVDLVCADGLYRDAGYPLGQSPDPDEGADNLDFWSHDSAYQAAHAGNLGDATDPFDGVTHTEYSPVSNPASRWLGVSRIRRTATGMAADVTVRDRRRAGRLRGDEVWSDTIDVVGDVTVPRGRHLTIGAGTTVRFAADGRAAGNDPERCELVVEGALSSSGVGAISFGSAAASPSAGDWAGIQVVDDGTLSLHRATITDALDGIRAEAVTSGLQLDEVTVRQPQRHGLWVRADRGTHEVGGLVVEGAGASGVVLEGRAVYPLGATRVEGCAGSGLVRSGGYLDLVNGEFADNGLEAEGGANVALREAAFGAVADGFFRGGVGIRCEESGEVLISGNTFAAARIGLVSVNARPHIVGNRFFGNELAIAVSGARVPPEVELNAVEQTGHLVSNTSIQVLAATNNWWGQTDRAWIAARMEGAVRWEPYLDFDPRTPPDFELAPNYPNPFNGSTVIEFSVGVAQLSLSGAETTSLEVRTATGQLVRRLLEIPASPGRYAAAWDGLDGSGRPAASGVYYGELRVGPVILRRKLMLLR
ncbi:MAG: M6 family metalloprotease domain-containing protein [Gemmatimonadota bacterium]